MSTPTLFEQLRAQRRADTDAAHRRNLETLAQKQKLAEEAADRADRRRQQDRLAAQHLAAQRRDMARARRAQWRAAAPEVASALLWATVIVLPITLAWAAQAQFALTVLHLPAPLNQGFPASVETGAWVCAFEAHRRVRRGDPAGSLPRFMWLLAGVAAVINGSHGWQDGGPAAGIALGAVSLLGVLLHSIRQGLDVAKNAGLAPGLALWRRVRYPRLSLAAASLRAARELDHATAWELAWIDRFGVGPAASRRERRLGRVIVAREIGEDVQAAEDGELTIVAGRVTRSFASDVREIFDARAQAARFTLPPELLDLQGNQAAMFANSEVPESEPGDEQALSPRAEALLPVLRQAIAEGRLDPSPGVKRITAFAKSVLDEGVGVPTAQQLRDALAEPPASLHAVGDDARAS
ncbi:hypothetical protein [Amycolatopsis sp. NPDC054798]